MFLTDDFWSDMFNILDSKKWIGKKIIHINVSSIIIELAFQNNPNLFRWVVTLYLIKKDKISVNFPRISAN